MDLIEVKPSNEIPPEFKTYGILLLVVIVLGLLRSMLS
jgi:hypothetical protein